MSVRILVLSGGRLVGGLRPLLGAHARRGRPRRLPDCSRESTPPGGSPTRAISEGEWSPLTRSPQRRAERGGEEGQPERQQDPSGGRADHRPHQVLENPPAPTTGAPCTHSSRPSPPHSHSTPSKPPS